MTWNFGDILDAIAEVVPPEAPALIHGRRRIDWRGFTRVSNALARALRERRAQPGDKVALYLRNSPEYLIGLAACFKARLIHVNVNYRYGEDELRYLLDNSDARVVVFAEEFAGAIERVRARLPKVSTWIQVDGEPTRLTERWRDVCEGSGAPLEIERDGKDLLFLYTGGTTGLPKGVMWQHIDLWHALGGGSQILANRRKPPESLATLVENVKHYGPGPKLAPACPLMHGTGLFPSISHLSGGGCVVTLTAPSFDAVELLDAIDREGVKMVVIVGDAFARPILDALDAHPDRWSLRSLRLLGSSGAMWSRASKQRFLAHLPDLRLLDDFGSSEAIGMGSSLTTRDGGVQTAKFQLGANCSVFTEDFRLVRPGSGEKGFIARRGPVPLGYYKDPEKTAQTFPTIDGIRYSVPGDWCTVEADGTLTLLGRGNLCINTGGEKVHPEEVEEILKTHADIADALVIGLPDPKWGQAVTAVVTPKPGRRFDEEAVRHHVRNRLAPYKVPKRVLAAALPLRAPNGKADYTAASSFARRELGIE